MPQPQLKLIDLTCSDGADVFMDVRFSASLDLLKCVG